ncbi:MAG: AmmeMemoRadiSam system radical SAM enzyme [Patescibacteria group bacterium]
MHKAELFQKKDKDTVKCVCCQRKCVISPGNSGFCGVRKNVDGVLYLSVYGKAIAVNIDPVEKKPLYHFMPGAEVFSFGTVGCNFRCEFCQNWDISQATASDGIFNSSQDLPPGEIVEYCEENEIPIIAYTYNEPTIFTEYAADTAKLAKKKGIKNVYVTNGYESEECLDYMKDWCDAMNIDIKSYNKDFYLKTCGGVKLEGVLGTVKKAYERNIWIECTTLVIPDLNDSDKELTQIAEFIAGVSKDIPWHVSAFHPAYKMNDRRSTPPEELERAYEAGKKAGLKFVYTGNIIGGHEDTICPNCKEVLIERSGISCQTCKIKEGNCPNCKEKIPGIWK